LLTDEECGSHTNRANYKFVGRVSVLDAL